MDIYYQKYQKYKIKYLNAKKINQTGGSSNKAIDLYFFKADWCGHCKNFMPVWNDLIKDEKLTDKINFIQFDSEKNQDEIKEWKIEGFPTIILKQGDKAIEYNGPRKLNNIKEFIAKNT
jgi:thiol-disulfide isomerase/thioredoxin